MKSLSNTLGVDGAGYSFEFHCIMYVLFICRLVSGLLRLELW